MRRGRIITIEEWGRYATLDQTEEAYAIGGVDKSWMDYSTGSDDPDNAWDQDAYYADFEKWWLSLPLETKIDIHNQIRKNHESIFDNV